MQCNVCGQDNPTEARFCARCGAALVAEVEVLPPAAEPEPPSVVPQVAVEYAGFWIRFGAAIIDCVLVLVVLVFLVLGRGLILFRFPFPIFWFVPVLYYWLFTGLKGQTPGKMAVGIKVVDNQGKVPGLGIAALREVIGKIVSSIALCIGYLWIAWDKEKRGWHDRIASTHVIKVVKSRSKE